MMQINEWFLSMEGEKKRVIKKICKLDIDCFYKYHKSLSRSDGLISE